MFKEKTISPFCKVISKDVWIMNNSILETLFNWHWVRGSVPPGLIFSVTISGLHGERVTLTLYSAVTKVSAPLLYINSKLPVSTWICMDITAVKIASTLFLTLIIKICRCCKPLVNSSHACQEALHSRWTTLIYFWGSRVFRGELG